MVALLLGACDSASPAASVRITPGPPAGGVLHVVVPADDASALSAPLLPSRLSPPAAALDPDLATFSADSLELFRCCLLRTLLSYMGQPTKNGGADLHPDLASDPPQVSRDELTWTFHLRPGLRYAPPLQHTEIVTNDIVRAVKRGAIFGADGYSPGFDLIDGFGEFAKKTTSSIAGLQVPDDHTLVVKLIRPYGDLGYIFSLPFTAPIPALPSAAALPFGVASGHDDGYGRFLVASGPYMIDGSNQLDFSATAMAQVPVRGLQPGVRLLLVRNPSWRPETDLLRPAYPSSIDIRLGGSAEDAAAAVRRGDADVYFDSRLAPQLPAAVIRGFPSDRIDREQQDFGRFVSFNLAAPPFDDVHVRRAASYAIDEGALVAAYGGTDAGQLAGHWGLDAVEGDRLFGWDPYHNQGGGSLPTLAANEMASSRYDSHHSGRCDATVCRHVRAAALTRPNTGPAVAQAVKAELGAIGIDIDVEGVGFPRFFDIILDPTQHIAVAIDWGNRKNSPGGADWFSMFSKSALASSGTGSHWLLGATPDQLHGWGYLVTSVPSVDERIGHCLPMVGHAAQACWAELDEYLMLVIVPGVPFAVDTQIAISSARVVNYAFDQFADLPALDRLAVR